jgi:hypothetical protein
MTGACDALFTARPLGPFLDIAETEGGALTAVVTGGLPYQVASALVAEIGRGRPAVVVIEDLHWADEATLDVIRLLARRVEACPALVLITYRDDELDRGHPLKILLGELPASLHRMRVPPLSATAVGELAAAIGVDGAELFRKTGGNPFFVSEVLAEPDVRIPDTVRDAVLARAARLEGAATALVEAVAIAPPRAELWLLEKLAPEALDQLGTCLGLGILAADRDSVAFRHELARLAVEDSLSPWRRVSLHRRALEALSGAAPLPDSPTTPKRPATRPPWPGTRRRRLSAPPPWARTVRPRLSTAAPSATAGRWIRGPGPSCWSVIPTSATSATGARRRSPQGGRRSRPTTSSATACWKRTRCASSPRCRG